MSVPTKNNYGEQACYAAFNSKGVFVGISVDHRPPLAASAAIEWLQDGLTVHRVTVAWARAHPMFEEPCEPDSRGLV